LTYLSEHFFSEQNLNSRYFTIILLANLVLGQLCGQSTCVSDACKREAEKMLSRIDNSVDICDDMFSFACGNYKPEIPNDKVKIDELGLILDSLQERLDDILSANSSTEDIEPIRRLKVFYQNCMDKGLSIKVFEKRLQIFELSESESSRELLNIIF
jgi:Peptidase family M13